MRFQQFVEHAANPSVRRNHPQIGELAVDIVGGWEVWLQVEIYLTLRHQIGDEATFIREPHFPDSAQRADFSFIPRNADTTTTWVELKVENRAKVKDAVNRFGEDIDKLAEIKLPPNDTAGAIVCIATDVRSGLKYAQERLSRVSGGIRYYLVAREEVKGFYKLNDYNPTDVEPGDIAVIYYIWK